MLENIFTATALPTLQFWQRGIRINLAVSVAAKYATATSNVVHQWWRQCW
jgi:hypothetical protein